MSAALEELARRLGPAPPGAVEVGLTLDPAEAFGRICRRPGSFFLDSALAAPGLGEQSIMGCEPLGLLTADAHGARLTLDGRTEALPGNPFAALHALVERLGHPGTVGDVPFCGGLVGYLGYEMGSHIERLPLTRVDDLGVPWMALGLYAEVLVADHAGGRWRLAGFGVEPRHSRLLNLVQRGCGALSCDPGSRLPGCPPTLNWTFSPGHYQDAVGAALRYIREGEIYQVNLSQRLDAPLLEHPWRLYTRLRMLSPAPFSAYLSLPQVTLCSSSPERFLKLDGRRVQTRPIKGTRPRGADPQSDRLVREELQRSAKDRAELAMIVDLERNDLGRVCEPGSVEVLEHAAIEQYTAVFHAVSTVAGTLRPDAGVVDLLLATFPGGSITGAPKIRAMQIIDELEPTLRGPYTGSIGYIGLDRRMDLNIAIRTLVAANGRVYAQVGGGVVADSEPQAEYQETLDKARALIQAIEGVDR